MSLVIEQGKTATEPDPRWASVVARNVAADGTFVYAVLPLCGYRWGVERKRALLDREAQV